MTTSAAVYVTLFGLSAVIAGGLASYAWRRRVEPGARPFAGLMVAISLWAGCAAVTLLTRDPGTHLLIERIQWIGIASIAVFMMMFVLSYTGYDELASPRTFGLLSIFPIVTIGIVLSGWGRDLMWENASVVVVQGVAVSIEDFGVMYYAFVVYAYAIIVIGALLIIRLVLISDYLFLDQAVLLVIGVMTPVVGNAVTVVGFVPFPGFEVTPLAFTVTGLTFGYALFRRRLFELVPATRRLGRDTAIATLDDGVLILDKTYAVIYLNHEAADVLDCDPRETLGTSTEDLLDTSIIDPDVPDALAELHIDSRFYEVRSSAVTDRQDRDIGYTLVLHDITARKRRERRLRSQRDELEQLDRLNETIREITQAFVNATSRTAIEGTVCNRLTGSDLYTEASIIVDSTDEIVAGDGGTETKRAGTPIAIHLAGPDKEIDLSVIETIPDVVDTEHGSWGIVPLGYDRSIYGALVLYTTRTDAFESRELAILDQFGDTISQAINGVENQRLLLADTVIQLEFLCPDATIAEIARNAACRLSLGGLVPGSDEKILVYCHTTNGTTECVVDAASGIESVASVQVIDDADDVVEFTLTDRSALLALSTGGTNVRSAVATEDEYRVVVEVAPETDVRALTEKIREYCPDVTLVTRYDLDRPTETAEETLPEDALDGLTERQHEVLEAAYRGGYFRWPRDRTAEEVADSISISSPTLHKHLRRAEEQLFDEMFDPNGDTDRVRKRE